MKLVADGRGTVLRGAITTETVCANGYDPFRARVEFRSPLDRSGPRGFRDKGSFVEEDDRFSGRYRYKVEAERESGREFAGELDLEIVFRRNGKKYTTCLAEEIVLLGQAHEGALKNLARCDIADRAAPRALLRWPHCSFNQVPRGREGASMSERVVLDRRRPAAHAGAHRARDRREEPPDEPESGGLAIVGIHTRGAVLARACTIWSASSPARRCRSATSTSPSTATT